MAEEQLANELDVTEKLVRSLEQLLLEISIGVFLASIFGLLLKGLEIVLDKDFLIDTTAVIEKLFAEIAVLQVAGDGSLALGLQVDLNDGRTELTVELRVSVLNLSLTEDSLDNDLEDLVINLEILGYFHVESFFIEQFKIADEHLTELSNFSIQIVRSDLVQLQAHFLGIVLLSLGLFHVGGSGLVHLNS